MLETARIGGDASVPCRSVAQLVEHRSPKPGVAGSSPATPASYFRWLASISRLSCHNRSRELQRAPPLQRKSRPTAAWNLIWFPGPRTNAGADAVLGVSHVDVWLLLPAPVCEARISQPIAPQATVDRYQKIVWLCRTSVPSSPPTQKSGLLGLTCPGVRGHRGHQTGFFVSHRIEGFTRIPQRSSDNQ